MERATKPRGRVHVPPAEPRSGADPRVDAARKQIRGSSLLLGGKLISVGAKFIAQLLIVRALSVSDYGAWAYALSVVTALGAFAHLSLDRAVVRFAAIYHEQEQYDRLLGTLLLVTGAILGTGLLFAGGIHAFPEMVGRLMGGREGVLAVLFVMVFIVPLEAMDALLVALFATFGQPRAIFFRKYVLAPAVQLGVVLILILRQAGVVFLAYGYVVGTLLGVAISAGLLWRVLREQGILGKIRLRRIAVPARELFAFSFPLMTSDWLAALLQSSGSLVLGYFHDTAEVAIFRVIAPVVILNQLVLKTFATLYEPTAARLYAQADIDGINDLYWRTSVWIAVLSFPVFAVTFAASTPLVVLLFGSRYEAAGLILAILALGHYGQASLGFNGNTVKVVGRVRFLLGINLLAALVNVALTLLLVPPFRAVGAAIAVSATMIIHNILKQIGLRRATGFTLFDRRYLPPFAIIASTVAGMVVVRALVPDQPVVQGMLAVSASALVWTFTRKMLRVGDIFPEARRIPWIRGILT